MNKKSALLGWFRNVAPMAAAIGLASGSFGCSIVAGITNPKAAFAINEPAPMSVVIRRADVASATAREVDRLMSDTGVAEDSDWIASTTLGKDAAEGLLKSAGSDPSYAGTQQVRVVPAEAWVQAFTAVCSEDDGFSSLLEATSETIAESYAELSTQNQQLADLAVSIEKEEKAISEGKDVPTHEKELARLEEQVAKVEEAYQPKVDAFLELLRTTAGKAPAPMQEKLRIVVQNLKVAVADARAANAAAIVRYPLAIPDLTTDLQTSAKRIAADVIEEQTGSRPDLSSLKPEVKLEGTDVKLTLNGIPADKLGSLSPADIVTETTVRLASYAEKVLTLAAQASGTEERLSLQAEVLDAWAEGLGGTAPATLDLGDLTVQATGPAPAAGGKADSKPRSIHVASCGKPKKGKPGRDPKPEAAVEMTAAPATPTATARTATATPAANAPRSKSASASPTRTMAEAPPRSEASARTGASGGARNPDVQEMVPVESKTQPAAPPAGGPDCPISVVKNGVKVCL